MNYNPDAVIRSPSASMAALNFEGVKELWDIAFMDDIEFWEKYGPHNDEPA